MIDDTVTKDVLGADNHGRCLLCWQATLDQKALFWTAWLPANRPARKRFESNAGKYRLTMPGASNTAAGSVSHGHARVAWRGAGTRRGLRGRLRGRGRSGGTLVGCCITLRVCAGGLSHRALPPPPTRAQIAPGGRHAHPNSGRPAVWRRARALRQDQKMLGCLPQTPLGCARWPCQTDSLTHSVP